MTDEIEIQDISGRLVRVLVSTALAAIGDTLEDDERFLVSRNKEPYRYVEVRLVRSDAVG